MGRGASGFGSPATLARRQQPQSLIAEPAGRIAARRTRVPGVRRPGCRFRSRTGVCRHRFAKQLDNTIPRYSQLGIAVKPKLVAAFAIPLVPSIFQARWLGLARVGLTAECHPSRGRLLNHGLPPPFVGWTPPAGMK